MDSTYIQDLDGLLPKLCALSRETGEERRCFRLRAAGLQALASMIIFLGKHSHMPPEFDNIVAVVLENYKVSLTALEVETLDRAEAHSNLIEEIFRGEGRGPVAVMREAASKLQFHIDNSSLRDTAKLTRSGYLLLNIVLGPWRIHLSWQFLMILVGLS